LVLAGILILMLLGALNYGNNLGFFYTFLLSGIGLATMLQTWRNLLGLELTAGRSKPVFVGQMIRYLVVVENNSRFERPAIELQVGDSEPVRADIPGNTKVELMLSSVAEQRGYQGLGRVTVSTRAPLGLLRAWSYVELDSQCLVYPRPAPNGEPRQRAAFSGSHQGDRGLGADDFVGLRAFRAGDPPKHIDWKAVARQRGLQTKLFGGDRTELLWLDWRELPEIGVEGRLSLLCRFVLLAHEQQQSFGVWLPGKVIEPGRDQAHLRLCLGELARFAIDGRR